MPLSLLFWIHDASAGTGHTRSIFGAEAAGSLAPVPPDGTVATWRTSEVSNLCLSKHYKCDAHNIIIYIY